MAWPLRPLAQPPLSSLVVQLRFSCNHNARILLHFILNYLEIKGIIGGMGGHFPYFEMHPPLPYRCTFNALKI